MLSLEFISKKTLNSNFVLSSKLKVKITEQDSLDKISIEVFRGKKFSISLYFNLLSHAY